MIKILRNVGFVFLFLNSANAIAGVEIQKFENEQQQTQYKKLIDELRCLVCQNQNLADSDAELAQDLRKKVAQMLVDGKSEEEIIDYMVARYGDFVLYRPPFKSKTLLLWLGPFVLLMSGVVVLMKVVRKQKKTVMQELDKQDKEKIRHLLDDED